MPSLVMENPTNKQDKTDTSLLPEGLGTSMFCSLLLTLSPRQLGNEQGCSMNTGKAEETRGN